MKRCVDIEHRQAMRLAPAIGFFSFSLRQHCLDRFDGSDLSIRTCGSTP